MTQAGQARQSSMTRTEKVPYTAKFEVVVIPVSDVDRANEFYVKLGWRFDGDFANGDWRAVRLTPPDCGCSTIFGKNVTAAPPGSAQGFYLVVSDIDAARKELLGLGVEVSEAFHGDSGVSVGPVVPNLFGRLQVSGPDPAPTSYYSFASFHDPDGNGWLLQEVTTRLPWRGVSNFDVATMTALLRETEEHHGQYEPTAPKHYWSGWYAAYIVARQNGKTPEEAAKEGKLQIEGALAA